MITDLESLRCFMAACEARSFRAAAGRVFLSPAAFGERIRRLEEELGQALFARSTRKVALTEAGRRLRPWAQQLLEGAAQLKAKVMASEEALPFDLTLGTRYELGLSWLVPNLAKLERARPERTIHLAFGDTAELLHRLRQGRCDAFVSSARLVAPGLRHVALHGERYTFVASPRLLAERPFTRPEHAEEQVLLDAHPDLPLFRYFLDGAPADQVWAFKKTVFLGTTAAIRARALEGAGVAVLPTYFVAPELKAGRLKALFPKIRPSEDQFRLVYLAAHPAESELRALGAELTALPLR
jgi:LysR family glycine cleavage system transcriptional activator